MKLDPDSLASALQSGPGSSRPPVHLWHPDSVQDIGMQICRDGSWYYQGSSIDRPEMVRLFASILRRDGDEYFLVTPVEKVRVRVELAPFIAVKMEHITGVDGPSVAFQSNVGDATTVDAEHPLWVEEGDKGPLPFVRIRDRLDALLSRSVFYELAESASPRRINGEEVLGVISGGEFWVLGSLEDKG